MGDLKGNEKEVPPPSPPKRQPKYDLGNTDVDKLFFSFSQSFHGCLINERD